LTRDWRRHLKRREKTAMILMVPERRVRCHRVIGGLTRGESCGNEKGGGIYVKKGGEKSSGGLNKRGDAPIEGGRDVSGRGF